MGLVSLVDQRKIGPTHGAESSWIPLGTPSGPQFTEAEMETELVEQLAFSPWVSDILTQPSIRYVSRGKYRRYTADVLFEVAPGNSGLWRYCLIEVKPARYITDFMSESAEKIEVAKQWCTRQGGTFCILTEEHIRTPYLQNVRRLAQSMKAPPDPEVLRILRAAAGKSGASVSAILAICRGLAFEEPKARATIERAIAQRLVFCDLTTAFDDESVIVDDEALARDHTRDPILRLVQVAEMP